MTTYRVHCMLNVIMNTATVLVTYAAVTTAEIVRFFSICAYDTTALLTRRCRENAADSECRSCSHQ